MAVTRDRDPGAGVVLARATPADSPLIRQVKDDLRDWTLGRVVWVADRGFTSAANRRHLAAGADGYILGEKLRSGSAEAARGPVPAGPLPGRAPTTCGSRRSRSRDDDERFVVCHNPDAADRDAATRATT